MDWIFEPQAWIAFLTLTILEIVLGIDNIVFISILSGRLPEAQREKARMIGLLLAMVGRVVLLMSLSWIMSLTEPFFSLFGLDFTGRDLILLGGGLFLVYKATTEIHTKLEGEGSEEEGSTKAVTMRSVMIQILLLDLVFSLDSVITAVGMADRIGVMISAVVVAVGVMMVTAGRVSAFIEAHPTVKMLALSFLLLIGVTLVIDGFPLLVETEGVEHRIHVPKGYIYSAMAFSVFVEMLNLRMKSKKAPVRLRKTRI